MSTSPVESSCTMAGARPSILSKSICIWFLRLFRVLSSAQNKKPADFVGGPNPYDCAGLADTDLRRHVRRVVMMMAMSQRKHELNPSLEKRAVSNGIEYDPKYVLGHWPDACGKSELLCPRFSAGEKNPKYQ